VHLLSQWLNIHILPVAPLLRGYLLLYESKITKSTVQERQGRTGPLTYFGPQTNTDLPDFSTHPAYRFGAPSSSIGTHR
jgi:hypothetical protein